MTPVSDAYTPQRDAFVTRTTPTFAQVVTHVTRRDAFRGHVSPIRAGGSRELHIASHASPPVTGGAR